METYCTQDRCSECPGRLVCHCLQVTEDAVLAAVSTFALTTVSEVRRYTGAGDGCTACHGKLQGFSNQRVILLVPHLLGQVVLQADRLDQAELRLQPVDVFLGFDQDRLDQFAGAVVLEAGAQVDGCVVMLDAAHLQLARSFSNCSLTSVPTRITS